LKTATKPLTMLQLPVRLRGASRHPRALSTTIVRSNEDARGPGPMLTVLKRENTLLSEPVTMLSTAS
jgi:hypothetical protein